MIAWGYRAAALLLLVASYWGVYEHGQTIKDADWQARWALRDAADKQVWALEEQGARKEEQRRAAAQEKVRADAYELRTIADAGGVDADAAGQRLHDEAASLAATVSCPSSDSGAVARGQATTRAAMVLSDLLARADARAGELAKAYDRARIAGLACEMSYTALTKSGGQHGRSAGEDGGG